MNEGFKQKRSPSDRDFRYESKLPPIRSSDFNSDTSHHIEELKSGQNNILVAVRARPLNSKENSFSNFETIRVLDGRVVILLDPSNQFDTNDVFRANRNKEQQYAFDFAFDQTVETDTIFEKTTKFLIPGVLNGFNATVFAYGATGAGKTYTMLGGQGKPGIMYLTMMELFNQIQNSSDKEFTVKVSYMEVYNETLRDLLSTGDQLMEIREDTVKGVVVSGVTEVIAHNPGDVMDILNVGSKNRTMEATGANVVSSRSHAVLQVTVERRERNQGTSQEINQSKLSLIDLAGSERASNTNNTGQRLIEGANINRSLLALGNCITLLSEKHEKGLKNVHIPYRDSKLTRLLKDSLGGNCRTVMITNVSPAVTVFEDTYNTLKYANRAKNIKTSITRNVLQVENHVEKYAQIISDLKTENDHLKKLLHNNHLKSPDASTFEDSSSSMDPKQALINDIRNHFDEEAQMKKKVFEAELQVDDIEEKIIDVQGAEDKINKARYDDLVNSRRRQTLKVEELKRDLGYMSGKRNQLQARIQKEKSKDTVALLNSVFLQSKMFIENMDLQQKERRVNNQMRLKDKELRYLQNQLHIKESTSKSLEVSNVHFLHTPTRSNITNVNSEMFNQNEFIDESLSFLTELNEIDNNHRPNGHVFNNAKQALHIPNVNPKVMYVSPNPASKRVLPPIKKLNIATHNDYGDPAVPASFHSRQPSQYYYKKHEFMVERTKPFEINQSDRPIKKKKAYVPFHTRMKNEILTTARRADSSLDREIEGPKPRLRNWQLTVPAQGSAKSLNDLSHISASSTGDGKIKNLRAISKTRVVGRYGNVALRYGASPYVGGVSKSRRK